MGLLRVIKDWFNDLEARHNARMYVSGYMPFNRALQNALEGESEDPHPLDADITSLSPDDLEEDRDEAIDRERRRRSLEDEALR